MSTSDKKMMTQAQYARHRGSSRAAVGKAVETGRITAFGEDKLIDAELADAQWARNTRARADSGAKAAPDVEKAAGATDPVAPGATVPDYRQSRSRREAAEAELSELALGQQRGELVRLAEVERGAFEAARHLRDGLANCARRIGATVAVMTTPDECAAAIAREHRHLLETWAADFKAMKIPNLAQAIEPEPIKVQP